MSMGLGGLCIGRKRIGRYCVEVVVEEAVVVSSGVLVEGAIVAGAIVTTTARMASRMSMSLGGCSVPLSTSRDVKQNMADHYHHTMAHQLVWQKHGRLKELETMV